LTLTSVVDRVDYLGSLEGVTLLFLIGPFIVMGR
jgi:hypothetical protein